MWLHSEIEVIEELVIGDCKWRLVENTHNKNRTIQSWSTLSKSWSTVYRYKIPEHWEWWKNYATKAALQTEKSSNKRSVRKTDDVRGTKKVSKRK